MKFNDTILNGHPITNYAQLSNFHFFPDKDYHLFVFIAKLDTILNILNFNCLLILAHLDLVNQKVDIISSQPIDYELLNLYNRPYYPYSKFQINLKPSTTDESFGSILFTNWLGVGKFGLPIQFSNKFKKIKTFMNLQKVFSSQWTCVNMINPQIYCYFESTDSRLKIDYTKLFIRHYGGERENVIEHEIGFERRHRIRGFFIPYIGSHVSILAI
jgi:hypothetical protein